MHSYDDDEIFAILFTICSSAALVGAANGVLTGWELGHWVGFAAPMVLALVLGVFVRRPPLWARRRGQIFLLALAAVDAWTAPAGVGFAAIPGALAIGLLTLSTPPEREDGR